jgi:TPR repeat protein
VDYRKAARWARLAADQGLVPAQSNLAFLYEHGWGVPLDYVLAFAWYSRASRAGDHAAAERLASLRQIMTSKQLDRASVLLASQTPVQDLSSSVPALAFGFADPIK